MNSVKFASAIINKRGLTLCLLLFWAAANSSFLTLHSSLFLHAQSQQGMASYYAKSWTGRRTANGDRLHHDSLTCAHLKYPFGTRLKVTNPANGKSVIVRVNDRGPYHKKRIIDLSWGAAKALGILSRGVAMVVVERVPDDIVIPLKPDDNDRIDIPSLELEEIDNDSITPVWSITKPSPDERLMRDSVTIRKP